MEEGRSCGSESSTAEVGGEGENMRTIAYYIWKIEIGLRNVIDYILKREPIKCKYCNKWVNNKCILFPDTKEWNNCVYFERRGERK